MKEIEEVLKVEKEAEELLENAEKEREKILAKAHRDAARSVAETKEKINKELDQMIKEKTAALEKRRQQILHEAETKAAAIRTAAARNSKKAEDLVINAVLGR